VGLWRHGNIAPFLAVSPWMESAPVVCFSYEMHSLEIGFRKDGLKHSYARQHSTAVETTTARGAYSVDDDNVMFESESSRVIKLLRTLTVLM